MKQFITVAQAEKDLGKHYEEMIEWIEEHGYRDYSEKGYKPDRPFMTIGQMIEFLLEYNPQIQFDFDKDKWNIEFPDNGDLFYSSAELCDALWEHVKEVLENDQ